MQAVDVHILHRPDEINIIGPMEHPSLKVHHLEGVDGNVMEGRLKGFSCGNSKYLSFVDPDDTLDLQAFDICVQELDNNTNICGVYTNSTVVHEILNIPRRRLYIPHTWSVRWHLSRTPPIHQLIVFRRDIFERVYDRVMDTIRIWPTFPIAQAEQIIWAHMAKILPWKFIDVDGYTWYVRSTGSHRKNSLEPNLITKRYVETLLTNDHK